MTTKTSRRLNPAHVLFSGVQRRLLALLLMRPDESFHVREVARLAGADAGSVHRTLRQLERAGLVTASPAGNQIRYQADRSSPIFAELQGIVRKTVGLADLLRDALKPLGAGIREAFVFGSVARGEEGPRSDIDLMVIGDVAFDDVVVAIYPLQEQLGREINAVVLSPNQYQARLQDQGFASRVASGPRIPLIGEGT